MKKGQGASSRKTLWEAKYGTAACTKEVRDHLTIAKQLDMAVKTLVVRKQMLNKKWPGVSEIWITSQNREIRRLEDRLLKSWQRVGQRPASLCALAKIAEHEREKKPAVYPVELVVLEAYEAGQRSQPLLLAIARTKNPDLSAADFSEMIKRYELVDLKKGKSGRKSKRPDLQEELEELTIRWLEGIVPRSRVLKKQEQILKKKEAEWLATKVEPR